MSETIYDACVANFTGDALIQCVSDETVSVRQVPRSLATSSSPCEDLNSIERLTPTTPFLQSQLIDSSLDDISSGLNSFFLIFGGALVYFMQTGFAMLCAGSIRAKNAKNVILWNLLDSAGGGLAFWSIGYAFAYGGDLQGGPKTFVGNTNFFLMNHDVNYSFFFFQFAFASALSSIVAGTIAERTQMFAYLTYSFFLVGFVYPVVSHITILQRRCLSP